MLSANLKTISNDTIDIFKPVATPDAYGGSAIEYVKTDWNYICRIYSKSGIFKITLEGHEYKITAKAMVDRALIIQPGYRVIANSDNAIYLVLSVNNIFYEKTVSHKELILSKIEA